MSEEEGFVPKGAENFRFKENKPMDSAEKDTEMEDFKSLEIVGREVSKQRKENEALKGVIALSKQRTDLGQFKEILRE
jgi:hypothetical protein